MKKLVSLLIASLILFSSFSFAEVDWSSMSVEEIMNELKRGNAELAARDTSQTEEIVLFDMAGGRVTLDSIKFGYTAARDGYYFQLNIIVENNNNKEVSCYFSAFSPNYINGWQVKDGGIVHADLGKKAKGGLYFKNLNDMAGISHIDDIDTVEGIMLVNIDYELYQSNFVLSLKNGEIIDYKINYGIS